MGRFVSDAREGDQTLALRSVPLSSDICARLEIYARLLLKWQKTINLVAPSTLGDIWTRHFADSAQILALVPGAKLWVDLGSGAGFPGLVIAIQLADVAGARVQLIESDQRKAAFLREVSRETGAPVEIINARIEEAVHKIGEVHAVTARALAPLSKLLEFAAPLLINGAIGIFPKGQDVEKELTDLPKSSRYGINLVTSKTDPKARIVRVTDRYPAT